MKSEPPNQGSGGRREGALRELAMTHPRSGHAFDPPWTWAEEELLRHLAKRGRRTRTVAEYLNRTPAAVKLKASRMGVRFAKSGNKPGRSPQ